jgi:hypothetical protein
MPDQPEQIDSTENVLDGTEENVWVAPDQTPELDDSQEA